MLGVVNGDRSTESGFLIDEIVGEGSRMLAAVLEVDGNRYVSELAAETDQAGAAWWSATAATCLAP